MNNADSREYLKKQIDTVPMELVNQVRTFLAFQMNKLGMFENDTDYLNAVPGMAEKIVEGLNTPLSECFEDLE
ncbi:MAG: hypothetical protein LBN97_00540 [Oscillospiraceae bacterium]|jgi:hypothetical protein|nr:hypothetical protein [Oscillospiraceae bacterium]